MSHMTAEERREKAIREIFSMLLLTWAKQEVDIAEQNLRSAQDWLRDRQETLKKYESEVTAFSAKGVKIIPLNKGEFTIVDADDYDFLSQWRWTLSGDKRKLQYAITKTSNPERISRSMHRMLLDAPKGSQVDHINGCTLDNRRCNLRLATRSQNQMNRIMTKLNTSGYKGVRLNKRSGKWIAAIRISGKSLQLGTFATAPEASAAYNEAAVKHFGEFAATAIDRIRALKP